MNPKYILAVAAIAGLSLSACSDDYLETSPESETATGTILGSTDNAALSINGICRLMTHQYISSQGFNGEGTIKTWFGNYPGNDFQKCNLTGWAAIINSTYHLQTSSSYDYFPWYYYYQIIGNANALIANIDAAEGTEGERQYIKAQALTFRAYSYSQLVQLYCYRWSDSNGGASTGVPLRLDESTGDLAASTLAEVYAQIYADLDEAINLFGKCGIQRSLSDFWLPSAEVAYAIKARAALVRQDWQTAATCAKAARSGRSIMGADAYKAGFNAANDEWIWGVYEASDQTLYYYSFYAYQGSNSSASICRSYPCAISKELIDQIPATDVRRSLYAIPTEEEFAELASSGRSTKTLYKRMFSEHPFAGDPTTDYLYSSSYVFAYMQFKHRASFLPGGGCFPLFRAAEMYYVEAEADCHLGKEADAIALVEEANKPYDADLQILSTADALTTVKLYRRFDLWGEGFDWFDYKRWGEPIVRHALDVKAGLASQGSFHSTFAVTINPSDANQWTWMVPKRESDYNHAYDLPEE